MLYALTALDDARSRELRAYLEAIKTDQGSMVQLMPEAMDLHQATVRDRPGVRYRCTASMAQLPRSLNLVRQLMSPWGALSTTIFAALSELTGHIDERYPCAAARADDDTEAALLRAFGRAPGVRANDGVVPMRSQLHGKLVWAGYADHLDVLGHFDGSKAAKSVRNVRSVAAGGGPAEDPPHVDWLRSGAGFDAARFAEVTKAIADGMLA